MRTSQQSQPTGANNTGPQHGLGSGLGGSAGRRLPVPSRERKPALAALAVLLILGGALISAYLVVQSGKRVSAFAIAEPVAAGERIDANMLEAVTVSNVGVQFVLWSERTKVLGSFASVPLVKGTLLNNDMLSQQEDVAKGRLIVGLALKPGQFPADGLQAAQVVALYSVSGEKTPKSVLLSADALVQKVVAPSTSNRGVSELRVSVAVQPDQAPNVAMAAAAGQIAVAVVPPGTTVPVPKQPGGQQPQKPQSGGG